jgi:hypothetical protein
VLAVTAAAIKSGLSAALQDGGNYADAVAFRDGSMAIWSGDVMISIHAPGQPDLVTAAADLRGVGNDEISPDDPLRTPDNNECP